ncbi:MAG: FAD-dependent monooxygenase [Cocleimonas sp.]|nr:FAD-dependent monooxygenase [Cocleimonas sp.]
MIKKSIAIIGGGVSALAFALHYKKLGCRVDIYERQPISGREGLGFIMLENGITALKTLSLHKKFIASAHSLRKCQIRNEHNKHLLSKSLSGSFGTTRKAFIDIFLKEIPSDWLHFDYHFSHFEWDKTDKATAAYFTNGKKITADLFLGCDGANSTVREQIFPNAPVSETKVKELVSIVNAPALVSSLKHNFIKYKSSNGGLASGLVPASQEKAVWFIQYDIKKYRTPNNTPQQKKEFAHNILKNWPKPLQYLLQHTDFSQSHLWETHYLYPLPRFYHNNVVLLGDAAHTLLPFTSQGVNSAIEDAIELANLLSKAKKNELPLALHTYNIKRKNNIKKYLAEGVKIQEEFLSKVDHKQKIPFAF